MRDPRTDRASRAPRRAGALRGPAARGVRARARIRRRRHEGGQGLNTESGQDERTGAAQHGEPRQRYATRRRPSINQLFNQLFLPKLYLARTASVRGGITWVPPNTDSML